MATYCVVCRRRVVDPAQNVRMMRFYLSAASADRAMTTAALENPEFRVLGIEPADSSALTRNGLHAA